MVKSPYKSEGRRREEMKNLFRVCLLVCLLALSMSAATVTFASGDGSATSSTGSIYTITPHPLWGTISGALWVSAYDNTGYGEGVILPNTNDINSPTMSFTQQFILPGTVNTGSLTIGADDTAAVWLNGQLLRPANWVQDSVCAAGPIACEQGEILTLSLTGFLQQGSNTLRMDIFQHGGDVSGAIWSGTATSVPEPGTYAMIGLGLLSLAIFRHRK